MTKMLEEAERNEDGDLIYEKVVPGMGESNTVDVNVTELLRPGPRRSSNVELLVIEAKHAADPDRDVGNPARPADADVAKESIERIESMDLEPAWRVCERRSFP